MDFTNDELLGLTEYFNEQDELPVAINAINVRLRALAATEAGVPNPDAPVEAPDAPSEEAVPEEAPEDTTPDTAPVEDTVAPSDNPE